MQNGATVTCSAVFFVTAFSSLPCVFAYIDLDLCIQFVTSMKHTNHLLLATNGLYASGNGYYHACKGRYHKAEHLPCLHPLEPRERQGKICQLYCFLLNND